MERISYRESLYRINGQVNPLGEDRYIIDDLMMPVSDDLYEDRVFHPLRQNLSFNSSVESEPAQYFDKSRNFIQDVDSHYIKNRFNYADEADVPLLNGADGFAPVPFDGGDYCREPLPTANASAWKKLVAATTMCLVFMIVELVGGYIAGSLAVMTDAAHLLSDCVGFLVGLFAVWVAGQPPTKRFTYGYHRAEVLGALLSILVIWILTGVFVYLAVQRLVRSDFEIHADAMMVVAAIGICINIVMGCILHGGVHSQNHLPEENINVRAAVVHVLGDLIQSIGVFISACIIKFYPEAKVVDPLCTFLCCLLVVLSTVSVLRESVWTLLETVPSHLDADMVQGTLSSLQGVEGVHALHVWALTPGQYVLSAHLSVSSLTDRDIILEQAQKVLRERFGLDRITIQVERHAAQILAQ